ncbi:MAG: hypothetical protein OCC46_05745 [Pseudodesulfovibrio sp.]
MTERTYKIITTIIAVISLTPLMLVNSEMWDMTLAEMAYTIGDFSLIRNWLMDFGYHLKYYTYIVTDNLNNLTGIPHKFFTNTLSVISVLGIAREIFRLLIDRYSFNREIAYLGAWSVIAFPVWHTLISGAVFINIFCFWLFMISVRLWRSNKPLAVLFFIPSMQLFSVFAMSVGFIASDFILTVNRGNYKKKTITAFFFSLALLVGFEALMTLVNVHGTGGKSYNSFNLDRLRSFINYGIMAVTFLIITFGIQRTITNKEESNRLLRYMLSFLTLAFFAGLAYWAVGRPLRFFAFGSFTARHTYLTCIPFAVLIAIIADYLSRRVSQKVLAGIAGFFMVALIVLLHQGYSHKVAATVFKDMLTESFAKSEEPPSGYVAIEVIGAKPPRHVHDYSINMCLFKAYGKSAWMANGFWRRDMDLRKESLEKLYTLDPEKRRHRLSLNVTGDAYTKYAFHLTDYHQEGRFWYWIYHLMGYYDVFKPRLDLQKQEMGS